MFIFNEHNEEVDAPPWLSDALATLVASGFEVRQAEGWAGGDELIVELSRGNEMRRYVAFLTLQPRTPLIAHLATPPERHLMLAPHVTRRMADTCRRNGLAFADGAGNVFVRWPSVLVDIEGRKPSQAYPRGPVHSAHPFSPTGLKVLFCLLSFPDLLDASYRVIAEASEASLGKTQQTLKQLSDEGYLELGSKRRLHNTGKLFDRWVEAYLNNLDPRLTTGRYSIEAPHQHLADELPPGTLWGGEAAAAVIDGHLRPATLVLYTNDSPVQILRQWRARRDLTAANVIVRRKFWNRPDVGILAPSTLIYADLVASGDPREIDAARRLRATDARLVEIDKR